MYKITATFIINSPDLDLAEEYLRLVIDAERETNSNIKAFDIVVIRSLTESEEKY